MSTGLICIAIILAATFNRGWGLVQKHFFGEKASFSDESKPDKQAFAHELIFEHPTEPGSRRRLDPCCARPAVPGDARFLLGDLKSFTRGNIGLVCEEFWLEEQAG